MMTLRRFASGLESIPTATAWYLADLGQALGKQELFVRQSPQKLKVLREHAMVESAVSSNRIEADIEQACPGVGREWIRRLLAEMRACGEVSCQGRGPAARWRYIGGKSTTSK
jgi:hypothetical protein